MVRQLKPSLSTTQKKAIEQSNNLRMTAWITRNPSVKLKLAALQAKATSLAVYRATGTPLTKAQYGAVLNTNLKRLGAQSKYYAKLSGASDVLQQGTQQGAVTQAQLAQTTQAYTDLLNNPPTSGDIDIKQLLIYGGIAVVGIIALSFLVKR